MKKKTSEYCEWEFVDDDYQIGFETKCGEFIDLECSYLPKEYKYCIFCGKKIKEV